MSDPFAAAIDAMFEAPGSAAAMYQPPDGAPLPVRVIRGQPDTATTFRDVRTVQASNQIEVRVSEVVRPVPGAIVALGLLTFRLLGEPLLDVEGLTWTCGAEPIA